MHSSGRAFVAFVLLALNISCTQDDSSDPCHHGCGWGGGSPHPYTWGSGGGSSSLSGEVNIAYASGSVPLPCSEENCIWKDKTIDIRTALPREWVGGSDAGLAADADADAGAGADADAEAEADADAEADAGLDASDDGPTGSPRGWGSTGRVAVVDLGKTPLGVSSTLDDAYLVTCGDRYETLSTTAEHVYVCLSAGTRPAIIVPLFGEYTFSSGGSGGGTSTSQRVEARTRDGARVSISLDVQNVPYESHSSIDCY